LLPFAFAFAWPSFCAQRGFHLLMKLLTRQYELCTISLSPSFFVASRELPSERSASVYYLGEMQPP
jgi:hypothetical protein